MEATVSRRRTLFAAVSAVVLGGGVTAGVAASVADYAEADAQLIMFCKQYVQADLQHAEFCRRQDEMAQPLTLALNTEWHRLDDLAGDAGVIMLDLEPKIAALAASSSAGVQAKAAAVARMTRLFKDDNGAALLRSLLADLLPAGMA